MSKGYVYILSNPCILSLNGKKVVKVGYTKDLPRRLGTLNTSVPENFKVDVLFEVDNYRSLELWAKEYIGDSLRTAEGSPTEFFEQSVDTVKKRILKCCRHHSIKPIQIDGSIYFGRSAVAIRNNLKKEGLRQWSSVSQLAQAFVDKYNGGHGKGGVEAILSGRREAAKGKWRRRLEVNGISFTTKGKVKSWKNAQNPLLPDLKI